MSSGVAEAGIVYKVGVWLIGVLATLVGTIFWYDKKSKDKDLSDLRDKRELDIRKQAELETKYGHLESQVNDIKRQSERVESKIEDMTKAFYHLSSNVETIVAIQKYKDNQEQNNGRPNI